MPDLLETLALALERPREVSAQVTRHLLGNYGVAADAIGDFIVRTLPTLEEDEVDLVLSPLFTPKLADQAIFAGKLGRRSVPPNEQAHLVERAVARPTIARLVTGDEETHRVRLGEVTVERYVYRLRLEGTVPEPIFDLIGRFPSGDHAMLRAVGRRAIWESDGRSGILADYLKAAAEAEEYGPAEARALLDLVERYKPADIVDLVAKIPRWREALRGDLATYGSKPFFSDHIERSHGGEHDRRTPEDALIEAKRDEMAFLERIGPLLAGRSLPS